MSNKRKEADVEAMDEGEIQEELRQELVREMLQLQAQKAKLESEKQRLQQLKLEAQQTEEQQRKAALSGGVVRREEVPEETEENDEDGGDDGGDNPLGALGVSSVEELLHLQGLLQQLKELTAERDRLAQLAAQMEEEEATQPPPVPQQPQPRPDNNNNVVSRNDAAVKPSGGVRPPPAPQQQQQQQVIKPTQQPQPQPQPQQVEANPEDGEDEGDEATAEEQRELYEKLLEQQRQLLEYRRMIMLLQQLQEAEEQTAQQNGVSTRPDRIEELEQEDEEEEVTVPGQTQQPQPQPQPVPKPLPTTATTTLTANRGVTDSRDDDEEVDEEEEEDDDEEIDLSELTPEERERVEALLATLHAKQAELAAIRQEQEKLQQQAQMLRVLSSSGVVVQPGAVLDNSSNDDGDDGPAAMATKLASLQSQLATFKGMLATLDGEQGKASPQQQQQARQQAPAVADEDEDEEDEGDGNGEDDGDDEDVDPAVLASLQQLRALEAQNARLEAMREAERQRSETAQKARSGAHSELDAYQAELDEQEHLKSQLTLMMDQLASLKQQGEVLKGLKDNLERAKAQADSESAPTSNNATTTTTTQQSQQDAEYPEDFEAEEEEEEGDGEPADPEAEAALLKELAELQAVRDRVTMLRQWLASGGQVDPSNPTSQALDALMMNVMQECADDPDSFSQVLTDRLFGDLSVSSELTARALPTASQSQSVPQQAPQVTQQRQPTGSQQQPQQQPPQQQQQQQGNVVPLNWDVPGNDANDRPKTSRRTHNPSPAQFSDYVVPSPRDTTGADIGAGNTDKSGSGVMVFDKVGGGVIVPVEGDALQQQQQGSQRALSFRSNRPVPLEERSVTQPVEDNGPLSSSSRPKTSRKVAHPSPSEFTDYVVHQNKPHLHDEVVPTTVVERAVFDDSVDGVDEEEDDTEAAVVSSTRSVPSTRTSPSRQVVDLALPPSTGIATTGQLDPTQVLVMDKVATLVAQAPGCVDMLLEMFSLFGGWDILGDGASTTGLTAPITDPMFRLKALALMRQHAASWTDRATSSVATTGTRTPVRGTASVGSGEPNYFTERLVSQPHSSPNVPVRAVGRHGPSPLVNKPQPQPVPHTQSVKGSVATDVTQRSQIRQPQQQQRQQPLHHAPVDATPAFDYAEDIVDDKTVSTLPSKASMRSLVSDSVQPDPTSVEDDDDGDEVGASDDVEGVEQQDPSTGFFSPMSETATGGAPPRKRNGQDDLADIEARLDRALDAEMAQRSRDSAQMTAASLKKTMSDTSKVSASRRRKPRRRVIPRNEGDESDPGDRRSEGSWSYASRDGHRARNSGDNEYDDEDEDGGEDDDLRSWESGEEEEGGGSSSLPLSNPQSQAHGSTPLRESASRLHQQQLQQQLQRLGQVNTGSPNNNNTVPVIKPPVSPLATPQRSVIAVQDSIDSIESREATKALDKTLQYLRELRQSLKTNKSSPPRGGGSDVSGGGNDVSAAVDVMLAQQRGGAGLKKQ